MALGMLRRGFWTSAAARATISVPRKLNDAFINVAQNAKKRPSAPVIPWSWPNGPGCFQYRKPIRSWVGAPPRSRTIPRIIRPTIYQEDVVMSCGTSMIAHGCTHCCHFEWGEPEFSLAIVLHCTAKISGVSGKESIWDGTLHTNS